MEPLSEKDIQELSALRRAAWSKLYAHGRLELTHWADLAKELDRLLDNFLERGDD